MGMGLGGTPTASGGRRSSLMSGVGEMAGITEINITPFVDVVLVLLVIFMVTAPLIMKDVIPIKLPKSVQAESQRLETLAIVITQKGQFLVNGQLQSAEGAREICQKAVQKNPQVQAVISADSEARHGDVIKAIDLVKSAGVEQFAIEVEKVRE